MKRRKLSFILFIYFITSASNSVFAVKYDTTMCIESKYVTRLCYQYRSPADGDNKIETIVCGYDLYDSLVIRVFSDDSLALEDIDYTKKSNMTGTRFVYDDKHRLIQEIWFHFQISLDPMLIEYKYQVRKPKRIRSVNIYNKKDYANPSGFYVDLKEYECVGNIKYIYNYYTSDEYSDLGFVILKCFDVDNERIFNRKKFQKYKIRYPWQSMNPYAKD